MSYTIKRTQPIRYTSSTSTVLQTPIVTPDEVIGDIVNGELKYYNSTLGNTTLVGTSGLAKGKTLSFHFWFNEALKEYMFPQDPTTTKIYCGSGSTAVSLASVIKGKVEYYDGSYSATWSSGMITSIISDDVAESYSDTLTDDHWKMIKESSSSKYFIISLTNNSWLSRSYACGIHSLIFYSYLTVPQVKVYSRGGATGFEVNYNGILGNLAELFPFPNTNATMGDILAGTGNTTGVTFSVRSRGKDNHPSQVIDYENGGKVVTDACFVGGIVDCYAAVKQGADFKGWFLDADCTQPVCLPGDEELEHATASGLDVWHYAYTVPNTNDVTLYADATYEYDTGLSIYSPTEKKWKKVKNVWVTMTNANSEMEWVALTSKEDINSNLFEDTEGYTFIAKTT